MYPEMQFEVQLNLHLSTTAIIFFFFGGGGGGTVNTLTLVSASLQWPLSSVPKVAVVERFNCICENNVIPLPYHKGENLG